MACLLEHFPSLTALTASRISHSCEASVVLSNSGLHSTLYDLHPWQAKLLLLQERSELIKANGGEMEKLFEKRGQMEQAFLERFLATAEDYQKQLEEMRSADAEDYNVLKVRSEQLCSSASACQLLEGSQCSHGPAMPFRLLAAALAMVTGTASPCSHLLYPAPCLLAACLRATAQVRPSLAAQAGDRRPKPGAAPGSHAGDLSAEPGEAGVQLPCPDRARCREPGHHQPAETQDLTAAGRAVRHDGGWGLRRASLVRTLCFLMVLFLPAA